MITKRFMQYCLLALFIQFPTLTKAQEGDIDAKMQKMASQLAQRIRATGKTRVGVADFNDLQGNVPELGKYLAESFQGELVNNQLRVINRQRLSDLLIENKLTAQKLLDPANALTIGKAAGMEVIVTGTITPIDERTVAVNILALDIQGAEAIASAKTTLNRTSSLNDLMRSTIKQGSGNGSLQETSTVNSGSSNQNTGYILMGDKTMPLPKESCLTNMGNYGKVCFENILSQPVVLYMLVDKSSSIRYTPNILIGKNSRNCTELLYTGGYDKIRDGNYEFYFHTAEDDEDKRRYGQMPVVVEGCKAVVRVINADRLFLSKTKPN